jgi:hypothetical protein
MAWNPPIPAVLVCDADWHVREAEVAEIGSDIAASLASDGAGERALDSNGAFPDLAGAIDIDISITPFTNTLPIRRLNLQRGQSQDIGVVYVRLPGMAIALARQRYTCLDPGRRYRYESLDSGFTRDIEVDADGLVTEYPGLFRRIV